MTKVGKFYGRLEEEGADDPSGSPKRPTHRSRRLNERYDALTESICVDLGFCGSIKQRKVLHVDDLLPAKGILTARRFAQLVLMAENMNGSALAEDFKRHGEALEQAFIDHIGCHTIPVSQIYRAMPWLQPTGAQRKQLTFRRKL